jgi:hypothetical protein
MFWHADLNTPEFVGSIFMVTASALDASQLVIVKLTTEFIESVRSELADSALTGLLMNRSAPARATRERERERDEAKHLHAGAWEQILL